MSKSLIPDPSGNIREFKIPRGDLLTVHTCHRNKRHLAPFTRVFEEIPTIDELLVSLLTMVLHNHIRKSNKKYKD